MRFMVRISFISIFLLIIKAGSNISHAQSDYEDSLAIRELCSSFGNACGTKKREADQIKRFSQKVVREKDQLKLTLESGKQLVLTDADLRSEHRRVYRFITIFPQTGYFLVQINAWEGRAYRMIHGSTGTMIQLDAVPIISPDMKRLVTTSLDLEAGYMPNRIQIYRIEAVGIEQEWQKEFAGSGPSDAEWIDRETISYLENTSPDGGQTLRKWRRILKQGKDGWEETDIKQK